MRKNIFRNEFWVFTFIFISCNSISQKENIENPLNKINNNEDTTPNTKFMPYLIDTSLMFSNIHDLFEYQKKKYNEIWKLEKTSDSKKNNFKIEEVQADSIMYV